MTQTKLAVSVSVLALSIASAPVAPVAQGFDISLNGQNVAADAQVVQIAERVDVRLADADVQISYNALDPEPRLNIERLGPVSGGQISLVSESNYPAFIQRGEARLIDLGAAGGPRLLSVTPLAPNSTATVAVPQGNIAVVYRVYGARGRYDETMPLPLSRPDTRALDPLIEEGGQFTATRNIRVRGGEVTVNARNIAPNGTLHAFGEVVPADPNGSAVIHRILPSGEHLVEVEVNDRRGPLTFGRELEIDAADWTYFVVADLELRRSRDRDTGTITNSNSARFQVFVDGETQNGIQVTGSLDTGTGPLEDAFRRLGDKDPRAIASRFAIAPEQLTFGDDSTSTDLTPTSGRVYLRVQRDESFALWGDYTARIEGNGYLRNTRSLYGAQLHWESNDTTTDGEARVSLDLNAAQRDQLFGRESFLGTDGTVFFLNRQDITAGTARVTIETRDALTGRVVDRWVLAEGADYLLNDFQGVLRLNEAVTDSFNSNLIQTNAGGDRQQFVVVEYEYSPIGLSTGGLDASGRAAFWANENLRFGVTGISQDNGVQSQNAYGLDLRYQQGDNSFVQLDYARSDGPGFATIQSNDAGLTNATSAAAAGVGEAYKLEFELDLEDISDQTGVIGGYAEYRQQGFSTLDFSVTAATGDQQFYGVYARGETGTGLSYNLYADVQDNELSPDLSEMGLDLGYQITDALLLEGGAQHLEQDGGSRTDVALRATYEFSDDALVYGFAQYALHQDGVDANDRYGIGAEVALAGDWSLAGEISDGTTGEGLKFAAIREDEDGNSSYFGWEVDPARTYGAGLTTDRNGHFVLGGRRHVNDRTEIYGENTYDLLGQRREITAAYGVDYTASDYLSYGATLSFGQVTDTASGDSDRTAFGLFAALDNGDVKGNARLEYRLDQSNDASAPAQTDTLTLAGTLGWEVDDDQRFIFAALGSFTQDDTNSLLGGGYVDVSLSYAYRPVDNERLNILASYRYVLDDFGQEIDGIVGDGPVQRSHVLNLEGNYDLDPNWTLGAKFGLRASETAVGRDAPYSDNDAWLAVVNARYHVVRNWDALVEARHFNAVDGGFSESGALVAVYRHVGDNVKVGVGYNFTSFSDDLTDLTLDEEGTFLNIIAKF